MSNRDVVWEFFEGLSLGEIDEFLYLFETQYFTQSVLEEVA